MTTIPTKISKKVPLPEKPSRALKYPFDSLQVGESFEVPGNKMLSIAATSSKKSRGDKKFTWRVTGENIITVWRTAAIILGILFASGAAQAQYNNLDGACGDTPSVPFGCQSVCTSGYWQIVCR